MKWVNLKVVIYLIVIYLYFIRIKEEYAGLSMLQYGSEG